jgi:hypothetical protein
VRAVGVKPGEGAAFVNEVLGQQSGNDRLADAAFFAADEIDRGHGFP